MAARKVPARAEQCDHVDVIINNAVVRCADCGLALDLS